MMGPGHSAVGASFGLGFGAVAGLPAWQTFASAGVASVFAAGRWLSPDVDLNPAWRVMDELVPDELLDRHRIRGWSPGKGGPLQHRGITHWWGCQLAAVLALTAVYVMWAPPWWWLPAAVITGWVSHLFGDFCWGMPDPSTGRGGGIPMGPWWGHVGLEWDVDGAWEHAFTRLVMPVVLAVQGLAVVGVLGQAMAALWRVVSAARTTIAGG
jgi:LexA-binding, inner membrane-associated putative hydrolase